MGGIPTGPGKPWERGRGKGKVEAGQGVPGERRGSRAPSSPLTRRRLARTERGLLGDGGDLPKSVGMSTGEVGVGCISPWGQGQ